MPVYQIRRVFEVERLFSVEAPSEEAALANPDAWSEEEEITGDLITTEITELDDSEG